jgi:hypothetical protein
MNDPFKGGTTGATVRWSARPSRPEHRGGQPGQANLAIPGLRWPTFLGFSPMWEAPVAAVSNILLGCRCRHRGRCSAAKNGVHRRSGAIDPDGKGSA